MGCVRYVIAALFVLQTQQLCAVPGIAGLQDGSSVGTEALERLRAVLAIPTAEPRESP
jgi:hypothetical protein